MTSVTRPPARTRLLETADRVLFERGIRATPVDELLRVAEVSASTLYTHFGSKDGLVAETLRVRLEDWRVVWDRCVVDAGTDEARLLAIFDAVAAYREDSCHPEGWCAFLGAADELHQGPEAVRAVLEAHTALLSSRLLHLSRPIAGSHAEALAEDVALAYSGTLVSYLRKYPAAPVDGGRRLAAAAIAARANA